MQPNDVLNQLILNKELEMDNTHLKTENTDLVDNQYSLYKKIAEIKNGEAHFRNMLLLAPVAIAIFTGPEFVIELANAKVLEYWGRTAEQVMNLPVFTALPEASGQGLEERLRNVLETGEPFIANEMPVVLFRQGKLDTTWINFIYDPVKDDTGEINSIMVVCNEVTEQVNARKQLEKITDTLNQALEMACIGTWSVDLTTDALTFSERAKDMYGFPSANNLKLNDAFRLITPAQQNLVKQTIKKAIAENKSFECEYMVHPINGKKPTWLKSTGKVYCNEQGKALNISGTMLDITKQKLNDQRKDESLKHSNNLLQSALDTGLIGISVLEAVRDKSGMIQDFKFLLVNRQLELETGRTDLVEKLHGEEYPGIKQSGLFETMLRVMETGKPEQTEYHYTFDGFSNWYASMFVKVDDGLVATNLDITERKLAEQEKLKNLTMLQQAELVATLGSWDFEIKTGNFVWSDGMYRLFDLEKNTQVVPEIYQQCAAPGNDLVASRIVSLIRSGVTCFEESMEILVDKNSKIIKIKASAILDAAGQPERIFGVNMDITEQVKLHEEKKGMESSQNQKIFRITLDTQEEERKRIAESLHNTLGQLLFGLKISMSQLNLNGEIEHREEQIKAKTYSDLLLSEAIKECRRISHELTPTILQDFGLQEAIKDICKQFEKALPIRYMFTGINKRLNKYLQTIVYRTVQELVLNIVKHAQATEASIEIETKNAEVKLTVQDNGIGFNPDNQNNGIGLKMIQSKIKLLNGSFLITANNGCGNIIVISLPYEHD